ncbi:kinase-like domain-containing protein [Collybia nuda]|uniref:Kinase-like domain-containing protein n=1 Tax=Collybia nuda TaxID=64659 RepID=A0A9P5XS26_9AGAR|nr:kinase-like domain-containing protein [Collybia nuda]
MSLISSRQPYRMEKSEIITWCDEVFFFIKKVSREFLKPQLKYDEHKSIRERQLCVDALYELIQLVRDFDDRTKFLGYYAHLVTFCQKVSLSPSSFVIKLPTLSAREPIETGASAQVLHGHHNNQEVAVKRFRLYARTIPRIRQRFLKESSILQLLQHPNVVPFIGVVSEGSRLCIVSPWMKNGDIIAFIKKSPNVSRKELIEQVADGLHFLSGYNIVHGDLKGANVLINDAEKACISDFGIASIQDHAEPPSLSELNPHGQQTLLRKCKDALKHGGLSVTFASSLSSRMSSFSGAGTYRWMAPERLIPEALDIPSAKPTFASDVFSLAMLAIEVYSGDVPFGREKTQYAAFLMTIAGKRPPRPPGIPDPVWRLIEDCWAPQPVHRPDIWDVYNRLACIPDP